MDNIVPVVLACLCAGSVPAGILFGMHLRRVNELYAVIELQQAIAHDKEAEMIEGMLNRHDYLERSTGDALDRRADEG